MKKNIYPLKFHLRHLHKLSKALLFGFDIDQKGQLGKWSSTIPLTAKIT